LKRKAAADIVKNKRSILLSVFFSVAFLSFWSLPSVAKPLTKDIISVTDFRGKKIEVTRPVSRIVCLIESALSGLYMLGAEERIEWLEFQQMCIPEMCFLTMLNSMNGSEHAGFPHRATGIL